MRGHEIAFERNNKEYLPGALGTFITCTEKRLLSEGKDSKEFLARIIEVACVRSQPFELPEELEQELRSNHPVYGNTERGFTPEYDLGPDDVFERSSYHNK